MFTFNLAYRHDNGEVEGFTGTGFTKESAERHAMRKLLEKSSHTSGFQRDSMIFDFSQCSEVERETIRNDWKIDA